MTFEFNVFYVFLQALLDPEDAYDACDTMSKVEVKFVRRRRGTGLQRFGPFDARLTSIAVLDDDALFEVEVLFDDPDALPEEMQDHRFGFCAKVRIDGSNTPCGEVYPLW